MSNREGSATEVEMAAMAAMEAEVERAGADMEDLRVAAAAPEERRLARPGEIRATEVAQEERGRGSSESRRDEGR